MLGEALTGFGIFIGYYVVAASSLLLLRFKLGLSGEFFRKLLHLVCVMSIFPLLYAFETWYLAMGTALVFAVALYPLIAVLERYPKVMALFSERRPGEIRSSLMIVFFMMALLIAVFWGILGEGWKYVIIVAIMAWGFGDAAAALVGKALGRRPIQLRCVAGKKTVEGTAAMYIVSAVAIFITLIVHAEVSWPVCLVTALLVAFVSAGVELVSRNGMDTITVPLATAVPTSILIYVFTMLGGF